MSAIDKLRLIVRNAKGDDLERAQCLFNYVSDKELDKEYGQSGKTYREILEEYRQERLEWEEASQKLEELIKGMER